MEVRGYNPPNQFLFDFPGINKMKKIIEIEEEINELSQLLAANPLLLNNTTGKAADVMDILIQYRIWHSRIEERKRKLKEGNNIRTSFDLVKSMLLEVMISNRVYNLDNPELLGFFFQKKVNNKNEAIKKVKKYSNLLEKINKVFCII